METYYKVEKWSIKENKMIGDFGGGYTMDDVKCICSGYKPNEFFPDMWERKNGKYIYIVTKE